MGKYTPHGEIVAEASIGLKTVTVTSEGYIQITGAWGKAGPWEKLVAIEATADVSKKTGVGRAAAGVVTLGLNTTFTSNMRGDIYLMITTSTNVYALHTERPDSRTVMNCRKLEAAGRMVIANNDRFLTQDEAYLEMVRKQSETWDAARGRDSSKR